MVAKHVDEVLYDDLAIASDDTLWMELDTLHAHTMLQPISY